MNATATAPLLEEQDVTGYYNHFFKFLELRSVNNGEHGIFAAKTFNAGDHVCSFYYEVKASQPDRLSVQVSENEHIQLLPELVRFINHSCNPNVFFDVLTGKITALKRIRNGEQLTFFYPSTEWHMSDPFDCKCGSSQCLGRITGADRISSVVLRRYRTSEHIRDLKARQSM